MKSVQVSAALLWQDNRFLICRRPAHKACGLLWELAGGKREEGESGEEALVRECMEELDITIHVEGEFIRVSHAYPDLLVHLTVYHCTLESGQPKRLEHEELRWILPAEIPLYEFCPADREILIKIKEYAAQRGN